jgi:hypothetical protein
MTMNEQLKVHQSDLQVLRDLYRQQREAAQDPVMAERRRLWLRHAALDSQRPMILIETMGVVDELIPSSTLRCHEEWARGLEYGLRELIFRYTDVRDDFVVEPWINIPWSVSIGDYGVPHQVVRADNGGKLASYHWDPAIQDLDKDFDKLHFRALAVDRAQTLAQKAFLDEHFGDILPVRIRSPYWWSSGLTWAAIDLIGLQGLMLTMYDNPSGLHRLMAFLRDDFLHMLDWFENEQLLSLNNENDYLGSGSIGYTTELPRPGWQASDPVCTRDLWVLSESQETVGVSPKMFEDFVFPYQVPIISRFGLSYYGCCEPLHGRIKIIKQLPNLRRVSVSPWCNQEKIAAELGKDYIFCRKPKPTLISTDDWNEDLIREDLRTTLRAAQGCVIELVMKDVHTVSNQPWRMGRWVDLARSVCTEMGYPEFGL